MDLYFLRHAPAVPHGSKRFDDDSLRPLTREGVAKMRQIAKGMRKLDLELGLILSSPYLRARQTAEIVAEELGLRGRLEFTDTLAVDGSPGQLVAELNKGRRGRKGILLVGHEPSLSGLVSTLLVGTGALAMDFKKGGLCKVKVDALKYGPCASLEWLLTPRQLRQMG